MFEPIVIEAARIEHNHALVMLDDLVVCLREREPVGRRIGVASRHRRHRVDRSPAPDATLVPAPASLA